ncbi:Proteasome subunit beta type-1 [Halotydeus destructor]|nr:Proteasome subunit beta type-1 [Halotydeus destructor]
MMLNQNQQMFNSNAIESSAKDKHVMPAKNTFMYGEMQRQEFSPYSDNGGNVVAVGGDGYVIIASDTRLSQGYSIMTREQPKLFQLTSQTVLGSTGCWCDILTFTRTIEARLKMYKYEHNRVLSTAAASQLIMNMLYSRRFFPYYISNVLAGLNAEGQGVVYSYDPIGHCEQSKYRAGGSSAALLQPLLDNQIGLKNIDNADESKRNNLTKDEAIKIIKDVFISATERDIYCGDSILIKIVTKDGFEDQTFDLRKD